MVTTCPASAVVVPLTVSGAVLRVSRSAASNRPSADVGVVGSLSTTSPAMRVMLMTGSAVSMVTGTLVAGLVLPEGSVAVTVSGCVPSVSGVVGVTLQVPSWATVVEPIGVPLSYSVMVSPVSRHDP